MIFARAPQRGAVKRRLAREIGAGPAHEFYARTSRDLVRRLGRARRWRLSLAAFGDMKTAKAIEKQAALEAERRLDQVKAQVVAASQASRTNDALMGLAQQQVASAQEALRLTEANLQAGTMTLLDVLQAQDAATQARLRHAEAVVRFNQSQIDLLAALGLLDAAALGVPADDDTTAG